MEAARRLRRVLSTPSAKAHLAAYQHSALGAEEIGQQRRERMPLDQEWLQMDDDRRALRRDQAVRTLDRHLRRDSQAVERIEECFEEMCSQWAPPKNALKPAERALTNLICDYWEQLARRPNYEDDCAFTGFYRAVFNLVQRPRGKRPLSSNTIKSRVDRARSK
jgi:hypothetical protein